MKIRIACVNEVVCELWCVGIQAEQCSYREGPSHLTPRSQSWEVSASVVLDLEESLKPDKAEINKFWQAYCILFLR